MKHPLGCLKTEPYLQTKVRNTITYLSFSVFISIGQKNQRRSSGFYDNSLEILVMNIRNPYKILILESQLIIAADLSLQFSKLGYDVIGFVSGIERLLSIIENKQPNIVLMNIGLRENRQRLEIARFILKKYKIPVLFLSANTDPSYVKELIAVQSYTFIAKPFKLKDLQKGIESSLSQRNLGGFGHEYP